MSTYGRQVLYTSGKELKVFAHLGGARKKPGGITVDWSKVNAATQNNVLPDGTTLNAGQKAIPLGTIMCQSGSTNAVQTVTLTGAGTLSFGGQTTPQLAQNSTAAQVQDALQTLSTIGANNVAVTGNAGGPFTVTFIQTLAGQPVGAITGTAANVAQTTAGAAGTGLYSPYNPTATDGTQNLVRGSCYITNETMLQAFPLGIGAVASDHPEAFDGGCVYKQRLQVGGAGQPTWAQFEAAFPLIRYAQL